MKPPSMFPCADRVSMPVVGDDQRNYDFPRASSPDFNTWHSSQSQDLISNVPDSYLKKISADLAFSEDVVRDRCFHALPYSDKYLKEALTVPDIIHKKKKTRDVMGRHNQRGSEKHMPCHIQKSSVHYLKPIKRRIMKKVLENLQKQQKEDEERLAEEERLEEEYNNGVEIEGVFLTESEPIPVKHRPALSKTSKSDALSEKSSTKKHDEVPAKSVQDSESNTWDKFTLSLLNKGTAQWIVHMKMQQGERQHKLAKSLEEWYGPPPPSELAFEQMRHQPALEPDLHTKPLLKNLPPEKPKKKWVREEETLLDKVLKDIPPGAQTDPYSDKNLATFYRLPGGIRRHRRYHDKNEPGATNKTADVVVTRKESTPPPTIRDFINPAVGDKMFDTSNHFQQEWLTGTMQVHQADNSKITMDTHNRYKKKLQSQFPRVPEDWFQETDKERKVRRSDTKKVGQLQQGLHRWKDLPEMIDDTAEIMDIKAPGAGDDNDENIDLEMRKRARNNMSLGRIIEDWRSKWHVNDRYADATPEELIRDMADIQPHIRMQAVTTVARAAHYRPPPEPGIQIDSVRDKVDYISQLPGNVFVALECLLEDKNEQVSRAAAITLYSLNRPCDTAEVILRDTLNTQKSIDRWAAAQCLAHFGVCDSEVIGELVSQLMNTMDVLTHERAAHLMSKLSVNSYLPHSMLGEQLNSSSWRHRVIACKVLPKLHGSINKDLTHKITTIMWNDWHSEVRKAAAQALGKTGHGKDVHNLLRDRLLSNNERVRTDALHKVGHLGIMTAKLMPVFLKCFEDDYISIRIEVCVACGNLKIQDDRVLDKLLHMATYDPIWRIKALAIQSLGKIGRCEERVRDCLLWALRYEDNPAVRAEACHSIVALNLDDEEILSILQDRYLVEIDSMVKGEVCKALAAFGVSATEDVSMVLQIKNEVRKLGTRKNVCAQITVNEQEEDKEYNLNRMIHRTTQEQEEAGAKRLELVRSVASTPVSATPRIVIRSDSEVSIPDVILREQMVFTPTADQELEAILSRENTNLSTPDSETVTSDHEQQTEADMTKSRTLPSRMDSIAEEANSADAAKSKEQDIDTDNDAHINIDASNKTDATDEHEGGVAGEIQEISENMLTLAVDQKDIAT